MLKPVAVAVLAAAALPLAASSASAQGAKPDMVAGNSAVKWAPAPPVVPKGALIAVISGDPTKDGPYVLRLKMPANYKIPAHHHPTVENVTVISGSFHAGMGDKLDTTQAMTFAPGGFAAMPAGMNHYAWTTRETVVQVHGNGPFAFVYVNPADDPSKQ